MDEPTDGRTDRQTDGPTDGRTDRRSRPLIGMRCQINVKSKIMSSKEEKERKKKTKEKEKKKKKKKSPKICYGPQSNETKWTALCCTPSSLPSAPFQPPQLSSVVF